MPSSTGGTILTGTCMPHACVSVCILCFTCTFIPLLLRLNFVISFYLSYDSMIPASDLGGVTPEPTPPIPKQWWVSSRWLTDSDQFNEWMTEEDYELIIVVWRRITILLPSLQISK